MPVFDETIDEINRSTQGSLDIAALFAHDLDLCNHSYHLLYYIQEKWLSSYVKEINNLIMLNSEFERREETMERLGYDVSIPPEDIRAYVAHNGGLTRCRIDKYGIDMPVFDETIDEINSRANELASRLAIEEES